MNSPKKDGIFSLRRSFDVSTISMLLHFFFASKVFRPQHASETRVHLSRCNGERWAPPTRIFFCTWASETSSNKCSQDVNAAYIVPVRATASRSTVCPGNIYLINRSRAVARGCRVRVILLDRMRNAIASSSNSEVTPGASGTELPHV